MASRLTPLLAPLCLIVALTASAATFTTGSPPATTTPAGEEAANSTDLGPDSLNGLWSGENHEITSAIKALDHRLPALAGTPDAAKRYVDRVIALLGEPSQNIRSAASSVMKARMPLLFESGLMSDDKVRDYARKAYLSDRHSLVFVSLLSALLPENRDPGALRVEYTFQLLEALADDNESLSDTARDFLVKHGNYLVERNVWLIPHTKDFMLKFSEAPVARKRPYLEILKANLSGWVGANLLGREELISALGRLNTGDPDLEQEFTDFLGDPKLAGALGQVGVFDREWVLALINDVTGADNTRKQSSLRLITNLMRPFARARAIGGRDFLRLWQYLTGHLEEFDDPLLPVSANIGPLIKSGWFGRDQFDEILAGFSARPLGERKKLLAFLDRNYDRINEAGWTASSPLIGALFAQSSDRAFDQDRLNFISNHPEVIQEERALTASQIIEFIKMLKRKDWKTFATAADVIDNSFDTWRQNGVLDADMVMEILNFDTSSPRAATLIDIATNHIDHNLEIFDSRHVFKISQACYSPHPKVLDAVRAFFSKHLALLKKRGFLKGEGWTNLRKSGVWDDLPQKYRQLRRFRKDRPGV